MNRLIFIIIQFFLVAFLILFIINYKFVISFEIKDFIYSFSSSYFFLFIFLLFFIVYLLQTFYFKIKFNFNRYKINRKIINKEKGYDAFVNGMIALANKDYKKALNESKKSSKYLSDKLSLSLILKSEVYKVQKKYDELSDVYEKMTNNEDTKNLGYRGMMEKYLLAKDYHHAFIYGEKLFNRNPYIEKIYDTLVNIIAITSNWQQLINVTDRAFSKKIINKKIFEENISIAYYEIAKIKKESDLKESILLIQKALKLRKNFPPYVKLYIDLLIENKQFNLAKRFTKKVWNESPHSEYKNSIFNLAQNYEGGVLSFIKSLIASSKDKEESIILYIEASIFNKEWTQAREKIKELIDEKPNKQICMLMAKIEEGDSGDMQKVRAWSLRANNGIEDNIWICLVSNKSQQYWSSISEGGHFNSLEWKQIPMLNENL